ncbi:hypothetical protein ACFWBF_26705 [Streptomyces sp. NPDC060028]|uniref:hypothetical protein n=1 Tax=Streptomyces sp. NPDC060028 TaxID=3347041 RepID=UPI0036A46989
MPGQRKRRNRQEAARRRRAETPGRWEPLFSTQDEVEFRDHVRRLYEEGAVTADQLRLDTFCGRLEHPTTYRVSVFVPKARP